MPSPSSLSVHHRAGHFKTMLLFCGFIALFTANTAHAQATGSLTTIPGIGGFNSSSTGISGDGSAIVGEADDINGRQHAYIWTASGGTVDIGTLSGGSNADASGISSDGTTVVGESVSASGQYHAFSWTHSGGMVDLGTLGGIISGANAASSDGSVVVGDSLITGNTATHAFRWTQGGGMVDLGTLGTTSWASGVSGDGNIVTGYSVLTTFHARAFRWTQSAGMVDIGTLGGTDSRAFAISNDGSTIVGAAYTTGNAGQEAFRWTQATGMTDLSLGTTVTSSQANAVSSDGSVIVGQANYGGNRAFIWTQAAGMQNLNTLLSTAGVNMTNTTLYRAIGVSANGAYITGVGSFDLTGAQKAFLAFYQNNIGGVTTPTSQQDSVQGLVNTQHGNMVGSRSMTNALLGMTRPVNQSSYAYSGALFGSAFGMAGAQVSRDHLTLLGGLGYGQSDYPNVTQGNAPTVALAARYTFDTANTTLHPYGEIGGWVTPQQDLTFSRSYVNGSGTASGSGTTTGTQFAEYLRGGTVWDFSEDSQINGFAEIGQQYLSFRSYSEGLSASNPFPASVQSGTAHMDVVRGGTSYTQHYNSWLSTTLSGAVAHAFDVESDLNVTVASVGMMSSSSKSFTWYEFGAQVETRLTDRLSFALLMDGTTGGDEIGTKVHGGATLTYGF